MLWPLYPKKWVGGKVFLIPLGGWVGESSTDLDVIVVAKIQKKKKVKTL
jgi:hypothetical protein